MEKKKGGKGRKRKEGRGGCREIVGNHPAHHAIQTNTVINHSGVVPPKGKKKKKVFRFSSSRMVLFHSVRGGVGRRMEEGEEGGRGERTAIKSSPINGRVLSRAVGKRKNLLSDPQKKEGGGGKGCVPLPSTSVPALRP